MTENSGAAGPIDSTPVARSVAASEDIYGETRSLGISLIDFKVAGQGPNGLFVVENRFNEPGGPARHLHHGQDEWFYALEGEFVLEVGDERTRLLPGDSLLAPREVPHVWAFARGRIGRLLIVFSPAGHMEAFFREVTRGRAMPPQDPALWRTHGMELLGPPLPLSDLS